MAGGAPVGAGLLVRAPRVLFRRGAFGVVVLGPDDERPVTLSGTAVAVWDAFARPTTTEQAAADLAGRYGTNGATVRRDVEPLVADLLGRRILVRC
jgi:hypothetical protein